jgi:hypothetical protein
MMNDGSVYFIGLLLDVMFFCGLLIFFGQGRGGIEDIQK